MFSEILLQALTPILSDQYSPEEIQSLASYISESIEINPREGDNIPFLRDSVLNYLKHPQILSASENIKKSRLAAATQIKNISVGIGQLGQLSAKSLKSKLLAQPIDQSLAKDIYDLNFGHKQNLGEIIELCKFNQGGRLGF
jgi:hypothetical protein